MPKYRYTIINTADMTIEQIIQILADIKYIKIMPITDTNEIIVTPAGTLQSELRAIMKKVLAENN